MVPERLSVLASKVAVPMALGEFFGALGVGAGEAEDLNHFGQMQQRLAMLLAPGGIQRRDRLGEAPEVDALAGGHGVAVHDRLEIAEARHLVDDDEEIALQRPHSGNGVGDGDPEAEPALDVLDGLLGRDDEEVGVAIGKIEGIEARSPRMIQ